MVQTPQNENVSKADGVKADSTVTNKTAEQVAAEKKEAAAKAKAEKEATEKESTPSQDDPVAKAREEADKILAEARADAEKIKAKAEKEGAIVATTEDAQKDKLGAEVEVTLDNKLSTNGVVYGPGLVKAPKVVAQDLVRRDKEVTQYELDKHRERNFANEAEAARTASAKSGERVQAL